MANMKQPSSPSNPIVFLDIRIGDEKVGRMVIELRKDVVPRTAENFRCLCTGEKGNGKYGRPLHYKGARMHKVQRLFMAQGGDVVRNDGSSGESIYGPIFDDENFNLPHLTGTLSMANFGRCNTNNSQFAIVSVDSPHLDGTNVAFGHVLRGFGIINEMEKIASDEAVPLKPITIYDCGEILKGDNWNFADTDESGETLPPFVDDWERQDDDFSIEEAREIIERIKFSGNFFFEQDLFVEACRKYKKALRYYDFLNEKINKNINQTDVKAKLLPLINIFITLSLNIAAAEIKNENYTNAKHSCDLVLKAEPRNAKALYRRGQAEIGLKNYDEAIKDLKTAHTMMPKNKNILEEIHRAQEIWKNYHDMQKDAYKNLFTKS